MGSSRKKKAACRQNERITVDEAYTSDYAIDELERAPEAKREQMMSLLAIYGIKVLEPEAEASRLANLYIAEGVIPQKYRADALHIAIATVGGY